MASDSREVDGLGDVVAWAGGSVLVQQAARVSRLMQIHTDEVTPGPDEGREWGRLLGSLQPISERNRKRRQPPQRAGTACDGITQDASRNTGGRIKRKSSGCG